MREILYEDEMLILADKPAGIPVHETKDPKRMDFTRYLQEKLGYSELRTINRLDLGTSGIIALGKNPEKNKEIDAIFKTAEKEYLLIGKGLPDWSENRFECFIKDGNKRVSLVRSGGKKAITIFNVLKTDKKQNLFLAKAKLLTGRRHQIRVSIASLGFPILGDVLYGEGNPKIQRMYLHSYHLKVLKNDGSEIDVKCSPPPDFLNLFPQLTEDL